jgi:hypothetical protein
MVSGMWAKALGDSSAWDMSFLVVQDALVASSSLTAFSVRREKAALSSG